MTKDSVRFVLAVVLTFALIAGIAICLIGPWRQQRVHATALFANSNGLYVGDQVRILGIPVGEIDNITPGRDGATVSFWYDARYDVPADAQAAILSPGLVSARVVQLTPPYSGGPTLPTGATIPLTRTAVPAEYDDLREQLEKLNQSLQPTQPGGVSPAGAAISTAAANVRGQGADIRAALTELSEAMSALGDHSGDIVGTVKSLSVLVSALQSSRDVLGQLNENLSAVTGLIDQDPAALGNAVRDLDTALVDIEGFLADNHDTIGTSVDKITSITTAIHTALPDLKQILHVAPNGLANFNATYRPHTASVTGTFAVNNFANPLQFICGAIQAASQLNYEQSAKLCVQYMAPILKNRQYNFPPVGTTIGIAQAPIPIPAPLPLPVPFPPFILPALAFLILPIPLPVAGVLARPNEITYSEDRMRPDFRPPPPPPATGAMEPGSATPSATDAVDAPPAVAPLLPAEVQPPLQGGGS